MASWIGKYDLGRESPTLRPQRREGPPRTPYYSVPLFSGPVSREYVELFRRCGWRIRARPTRPARLHFQDDRSGQPPADR